MSADFERVTGALEREDHRGWMTALAVALGLVALWGLWLCTAEVSIHLATDQARLEVSALVHPVRAEVGGRVRTAHLGLGREVHRGDVLLELDSEEQRLAVEEARARIAASERILADLEQLAAAEAAVIHRIRRASEAAMDEADARADQAAIAARFAALEAERSAALHSQGYASALDSLGREAEAKGQRSRARAERLAGKRAVADHETAAEERRVELERLELEAAEKAAEIAADRALIRRLELDLARRSLRAPVDGRLGWVGDMSTGLIVEAGDPVATVVPDGELQVVAELPVREAVGRVRTGQAAVMRLHAYPWAQYGVLTGHVVRVASEPREDRLRVEVELDAAQAASLPREHGLRGSLEITVERATPLTLLLRAVGTFVAGEERPA